MTDPTFDVASEDDDAPLTDSVSQSEQGEDDLETDGRRDPQDDRDPR